MEWFGCAAFILICCYMSKVSRAEKKIKKLEKKLALYENNSRGNKPEGDLKMSEMINQLKGKCCKIKFADSFEELFNDTLECTVADVEDEWIKLTYTVEKKKTEPKTVTKIVRTDNIESFEIIE